MRGVKTIHAKLAQRFIFNFRLRPETVEAIMQTDQLTPYLINGSAVGSFCILELTDMGFGSIPNPLNMSTVNCSYRYGAVDVETGEPCVYVEERCTNSKLGSWLTSLGFPGFHPYVAARIEGLEREWQIDAQGPLNFSAKVTAGEPEPSLLFESEANFREFMATGARSYCPSVEPAKLNIVDLKKSDSTFEALSCRTWNSDRFDGEQFDSAYRTVDGKYEWTFVGQCDSNLVKL